MRCVGRRRAVGAPGSTSQASWARKSGRFWLLASAGFLGLGTSHNTCLTHTPRGWLASWLSPKHTPPVRLG
jgi:hypothetical protein